MGNFQDQFENVREEASEISQRHRIENTVITHQHHSLVRSQQQPSAVASSHVVDHEMVHSTVMHRPSNLDKSIAVQPAIEEEKSESDIRERLEQLDLTFYQHLALLDYQFKEIPTSYQKEYSNLETIEQKDLHGIKYIGEWKDNLLHGNGVLLSNTSKYIGQFRFGLKHFHGREIFRSEVYEGEFEAGRRKGLGVRYTEESTEIGVFNGHLIFGTIEYSNGNQYKGTLKHNKYHGGGVDFSSASIALSEQFDRLFPDAILKDSAGRFVKEHPDDGKGNIFYNAQTETWYENCTFNLGVLSYARIIYSNGNIYQGELQKGRKHGYGKFIWKDGSTYQGQYQCDEKHGRGTLKIPGKEFINKEFVHGEIKDEIQSVIDDQNSEMPSEWL